MERPPALPLHLREAPGLDAGDVESADGLMAALLAPVRSGMIVTRWDVARAARELGLGLRAGERRFVIKALLDQDSAAVLDWLRREAEKHVGAHRAREAVLGEIAGFWSVRANRTAETLRALLGAQEKVHAGSAGN